MPTAQWGGPFGWCNKWSVDAAREQGAKVLALQVGNASGGRFNKVNNSNPNFKGVVGAAAEAAAATARSCISPGVIEAVGAGVSVFR